jgi:hypothetical protein
MPGVSKREWVPEEDGSYGLAYGEDDIQYAIQTRELMLDKLNAVALHNQESAQSFVMAVKKHFALT